MPAISTDRPVRNRFKQTAGRRRGKKSYPARCTGGRVAPDFLKQQFLPISFNEGCNKKNWEQIERDFFVSAQNLCALHNLALNDDPSLPFPMNVAAAYRSLKEQLGKQCALLSLVIAENRKKTTLATIKMLERGYDLYYVPLNALDELHKNKNRACFELVLSVFGYLNKHARLPLLCENDYLSGCYEAITDWVIGADNELEEKEYKDSCVEIKAMQKKINILEDAVLDPAHLAAFEERLQSFKPSNRSEKKLKTVAGKFLTLWQRYPNTSFYKNISCDHLEEEESERAYPDHYFSFFWDDHSWMHDHLMEYVNNDLQEMSAFELPVSVQYFDRRQKRVSHSLPFEIRLLDLIDELCAVLYRFNYEKHHS